MYFRLNPECYYIKGDQNGAIYDLIEGDIYALNPKESQTIETCEDNGVVDPKDPFLCELKQRTVGNFYEKKVYIEKLRLGSPIADFQLDRPPVLIRAFLEIDNRCDRSCWYCGCHGVSRSQGCFGCNTWDEDGTPVHAPRWKELIDELHHLNCMSLLIKGGDLTRNWGKTQEILEYANKKFPSIFVIGHKQHFSKETYEYLENKANLILQTDSISDIGNQHQYLLTMDYQKSQEFAGNLPPNVMVDMVSRNFDPLQPDSPLSSKKKMPKTNLERFTHNNKLHPCLAQSITISWNGEVLPCPMMRNYSLGNINDRKLWTFFKNTPDSIQEFWNISLTRLDKCGKCEFRYACTDCRALETAKTGDLKSKVLCNYDPSKGMWQQPAA
ncbi:MAG: SPASM domain-containing protein [Methanoregula sp.]|jgi:radical SAM protein with 4Fe4S-binding SPASM domain|nr:SPASM domain-containing protein [Methanoregula sp.]